LALRC
jgi:hypothetical protein